jgi:hypothetical protein
VDIVRGGRGRALCLCIVSWLVTRIESGGKGGRATNRLFGERLIYGGGIGLAFIWWGAFEVDSCTWS